MSSFIVPSDEHKTFLFWNRVHRHVMVAGKILQPADSTLRRDQPRTDVERAILLPTSSRFVLSALKLAKRGDVGVREVVTKKVVRLPFSPSVVGLRVVDVDAEITALLEPAAEPAVEPVKTVEPVKPAAEPAVEPVKPVELSKETAEKLGDPHVEGIELAVDAPNLDAVLAPQDIDPEDSEPVPSKVPEPEPLEEHASEPAVVDPAPDDVVEPDAPEDEPADSGTDTEAGGDPEGEGDPADPEDVGVRIADAALFATIPWEDIERAPEDFSMVDLRHYGEAFEPAVNHRSRSGIRAELLEARAAVSS